MCATPDRIRGRLSCSWLNAVEGFFARLARRRLKRGVFRSLVDLQAAINDLQAAINRFFAEHNDRPKPFTWTADPDKIIAAVKRGHQALGSTHQDSKPWLHSRLWTKVTGFPE